MARGPCTFKESDATRAIRSAVKAGLAVERVEIEPGGKIVVVTAQRTDKLAPGKGWEGVQ